MWSRETWLPWESELRVRRPAFRVRSRLIVAAVLAVACSAKTPHADSVSAVSKRAAAGDSSHASDGASEATPAVAHDSARTAPVAPCRASEVRITRRSVDAAAGNRFITYRVANVGGNACTVAGFPEIALLDSAGHKIAPTHVTHTHGSYLASPHDSATVPLAPGQAALFSVAYHVVEGPTGWCAQAVAVRVALPGTSGAEARRVGAVIPQQVRACEGDLNVTPLVRDRGQR